MNLMQLLNKKNYLLYIILAISFTVLLMALLYIQGYLFGKPAILRKLKSGTKTCKEYEELLSQINLPDDLVTQSDTYSVYNVYIQLTQNDIDDIYEKLCDI